MNKDNKTIKDFENEIAAVINNSGLPIELVRLVLYQIYTDVKDLAERAIYKENNSEEHTISVGGAKDGESIQPNQLGELPE